MARQPVFVDPPDILDALTEPLPDSKPPAPPLPNRTADNRSQSVPRPPAAAPIEQPAFDRSTHDTHVIARTTRPPAPHSRPPRSRDGHTVDPTPKRVSPNVSLYLSDAAKDELMKLKIDLKMDYTDIVLDALKARHPHRNWGS